MNKLSTSAQQALATSEQTVLNFFNNFKHWEPIADIYSKLSRVQPGDAKTREGVFAVLKKVIPPNIETAMRNITGYTSSSQPSSVVSKDRAGWDKLLAIVKQALESKKKQLVKPAIKEFRITKSHLKEIILEELANINEAALNPSEEANLTAGFSEDELAAYRATMTLNDLTRVDAETKKLLGKYPRVQSAIEKRAKLILRKVS